MLRDDAVTFEDKRARDHVIEESTIVGDHDQRTGVIHEDVLQDVESLGVEIVRRFVEHQHVGGLGEESGEEETVTFAAREHLGLGASAGRVEKEVLQVADHVARAALDRDRIAVSSEVLSDGLIVVDLLAHLVEVDDFHLRTELQDTGGGRQLAEEHLDQSGLAGAVGADEADLVATVEDEAEVADEGRAARVGEGDFFGFDDADPGAFGFADFHLRGTGDGAQRTALGAHLHEGFHASIGFSAAGARAATGPGFFLSEFLIKGGALTFFSDEELFLADEVGVVVTGPARELTAVELDDAVGHASQEGAVVRDEEQGDLLFEEELFHPQDRIEVHVIGRLVEQE